MKNYELTLPEGYEEGLTVDAQSKKLSVLFTLVSLGITVGTVALGYVLVRPSFSDIRLWHLLLFAAALFAYIVLHELVHGAAYKALTGQKLTFGMTATVAFCGVPTVYVYRKTALIALLSPFVAFTLLFGGLIFLPVALDKFFFTALLGFHVGGCSGDLYVTGLYLFKLKDSTVLMQDTGPKQTFYVKR